MISRLDAYAEALQTNPLSFLLSLAYTLVVVLTSLILHECAHGYVAYRCGDPTAKMMGRLSLNPKAHLDPMGTLSMFLIGFGWAKPVPVDPSNFRHGKRDEVLVAFAGIVTNMILCLLSILLSVVVGKIMFGQEYFDNVLRYSDSVSYLFSPFYTTNLNSGGLDIANGTFSAVMTGKLAVPWLMYVQRFLLMMAQSNLCLAIFNFLPIPPLDGYHLLNNIIFRGKLQMNRKTFMVAEVAMIALILSGVLDSFLGTALFTVYEFLLNGFLSLGGLV